jgi:hypothetical protein
VKTSLGEGEKWYDENDLCIDNLKIVGLNNSFVFKTPEITQRSSNVASDSQRINLLKKKKIIKTTQQIAIKNLKVCWRTETQFCLAFSSKY